VRACEEADLNAQFEQRLAALDSAGSASLLRNIRRGIEKESLRITPQGRLAQTPHPEALGSALAHPSITTDYSEALLEFITGASTELAQTLDELDCIHRFVYPHIGEELLWTSSMPCVLERDEDIPVARYGSSNVARMKTVYRIGLGHRYGRLMQTIAGIHFNFSLDDAFWDWLRDETRSPLALQEFKTEQYFALIRNFHRHVWLPVYLFGASPALCGTFVAGRRHALEPLGSGTLHAPFGTSLRMGDLGYQSSAQRSIDIPYNSLEDYLGALTHAITEPHPDYVRIGVKSGDEWRQLSTSLLQIENEFYATIRPKRVTRSGESPRRALASRGVEYIEVRCLDLDPFEPIGIARATARFLDAFLLHCLLHQSPPSDAAARQLARENLLAVVNRGREPGLRLRHPDGSSEEMQHAGLRMLDEIAAIGALLDAARGSTEYRDSIALQRAKLERPELTPSARVLEDIRAGGNSFFRFAMAQSERHREHFLGRPLDAATAERFARIAGESLEAQRAIERADAVSFESYLAAWYAQ
jgi:glutamate--cysteine ligase